MRCTVCGRTEGFIRLYTISGYALDQLFPLFMDSEIQQAVMDLRFHVCDCCLNQRQIAVGI